MRKKERRAGREAGRGGRNGEVGLEVMAVALDDGEQLPRVLTFAPINCS